RFYQHKGLDFRGISRAILVNIKENKITQGGSTITQQLARNLLRDNSKTLTRKVKEALKAYSLEAKHSKDEIIDLYFNNIYFGRNLRGIRAAGLYYFGKELNRLSHVELVALLTILRGPNYYINHLDKAYLRFQSISKTLLEKRLISKNRFDKNSK